MLDLLVESYEIIMLFDYGRHCSPRVSTSCHVVGPLDPLWEQRGVPRKPRRPRLRITPVSQNLKRNCECLIHHHLCKQYFLTAVALFQQKETHQAGSGRERLPSWRWQVHALLFLPSSPMMRQQPSPDVAVHAARSTSHDGELFTYLLVQLRH